ncbi:MAG: BPTI/Kunitz domain-containing protein [Thermoplasmata archaeon]|nr:MAG: BPTI/Kunitz domain-containing protein [Thermoplasmata archaeon]
MKKFIIISICCLIFSTFATAAVITINLDSVPTDLDCDTKCLCDQNWVESNIVMHVTTSNSCTPNGCVWEHGNNIFPPIFDKGVLLSPGRLMVDLDSINDPITKIEVILEDYCPLTGCSSASIYDGDSRIAIKTSQSDLGPINEPGYFIFDRTISGISTVDKLIVSSCNGHVGKIKITTTPINVCELPIDPGPCYGYIPRYGYNKETGKCEKFIYGGCGGNQNNFSSLNKCQESCGGTTYSTCSGYGCGTTYSTCSGFGCGTTYSTCGLGCGTT